MKVKLHRNISIKTPSNFHTMKSSNTRADTAHTQLLKQ